MQPLEIPTRENSWMIAFFLPILFLLVYLPDKHLSGYVYITLDAVALIVLIWMIVRTFGQSIVAFGDKQVVVSRRRKLVKSVANADIERVVVVRGAFTIYETDKRVPAVMRAIQVRSRADKTTYAKAIEQWGKVHKVNVEVK